MLGRAYETFRCALKSRHVQCTRQCLLWASSFEPLRREQEAVEDLGSRCHALGLRRRTSALRCETRPEPRLAVCAGRHLRRYCSQITRCPDLNQRSTIGSYFDSTMLRRIFIVGVSMPLSMVQESCTTTTNSICSCGIERSIDPVDQALEFGANRFPCGASGQCLAGFFR